MVSMLVRERAAAFADGARAALKEWESDFASGNKRWVATATERWHNLAQLQAENERLKESCTQYASLHKDLITESERLRAQLDVAEIAVTNLHDAADVCKENYKRLRQQYDGTSWCCLVSAMTSARAVSGMRRPIRPLPLWRRKRKRGSDESCKTNRRRSGSV